MKRVPKHRTLNRLALVHRCAPLLLAALLCSWQAPADTRTDGPAAGAEAQYLDQFFPRSSLQIATPDARLHKLQVWVADDDARRARGLMFIRHLDEDAGMLFIYPRPREISMWMKNTHIPLDMLFVDADGRVARVVEHTQPMSLETIESGAQVLAVIELNAGSAARMKIRSGARVIHPAFSQP